MGSIPRRKPGIAAYVLAIMMGHVVIFCLIGLLVATLVPGFMRAREVSRLNTCQENQVKLDAALMQYMLENNFDSVEETATVANLGAMSQSSPGDDTWVGVLVGEHLYLRSAPECPAGGLYVFTPGAEHNVGCTLSTRTDVHETFDHTYPSGD